MNRRHSTRRDSGSLPAGLFEGVQPEFPSEDAQAKSQRTAIGARRVDMRPWGRHVSTLPMLAHLGTAPKGRTRPHRRDHWRYPSDRDACGEYCSSLWRDQESTGGGNSLSVGGELPWSGSLRQILERRGPPPWTSIYRRVRVKWVTPLEDETASTSKRSSSPSRPSQRRVPRPRRMGT